jgi:hypothetical protein
MEKKKEKQAVLKECKYRVTDYRAGKVFTYVTKMDNSDTVIEAMQSLLKHSDLSVSRLYENH